MKRPLATFIALTLLSNHGAAQAPLPTAELVPSAQTGFYRPNELLQLVVPDAVPAQLVAEATVELDGIDVTALAWVDGREVGYQPVQPLQPGTHKLRLVHYASDGSVQELGFWQVKVRQSHRYKEAQLDGQFDLTVDGQVLEKNRPTPAVVTALGGGQLQGRVAQDAWAMQADASLAFASEKPQSLTGRQADIPTFTATAEAGRYQFTLGDQSLGQANLVNDGYQRRGIATAATLSELESTVTVFSTSTSERIGIDGGVGVSDGDNRLTGVHWQYYPVDTDNTRLYIGSHYLSGKLSAPDYAAQQLDPFAPQAVHEGKAYNLIIDSQWLARQVRLRLEAARSRYDFDDRNTGFDPYSDEAWSALAVYQPTPAETGDAWELTLGAEAKELGTFYKSIANPHTPADKTLRRLFASAAEAQWYWNLTLAEEGNNLERNPAYAATETRQWTLSGGYASQQVPEAGTLFALLGQPAYHWSMTRLRIEDDFTPSYAVANDLASRNMVTGAEFMHETWQWSASFSQDSLDDFSGWQPATRTRGLQLGAGFNIGEHSYLGASWQLERTLFRDQDVTTRRQLYSLDVRATFIPEVLSANLSMGANYNRAADDPYFALRDRSTYASGDLTWHIREADGHKAGIDLSVLFSRDDYRDKLYSFNDSYGYQALIRLSTSVPVALPGGQQ